MWIFTTIGFFSCVCGHPAKYGDPADTSVVMIRARERSSLAALKSLVYKHEGGLEATALGLAINAAEIVESPDNDYRFRITIPQDVFPSLMFFLAAQVKYDNFKSATMAAQGRSLYESALHSVWHVMHALQEAVHPSQPRGRDKALAPRARAQRLPRQGDDDAQEAGVWNVGTPG